MACREKLKQRLLSIRLPIVPLIISMWEQLCFVGKYFCRFGSDNDFVLRVAPLRDEQHDSYRNYFPPPLYGIPPGKGKGSSNKYAKYGLFLWPDRLYQDVRNYFFLLILTVVPFVMLCWNIDQPSKYYFILGLLVFLAICTKLFFILYFRTSSPVLSQIWQLWPESQYNRFLTVPHFTDIERKDVSKEHHQYWKPDVHSPLSHQPSFYAKGKNTLQEVILHLAVFDYLFYPKESNKNGNYRSLNVRGWFYLFSPALIAYGLLLVAFFLSSAFYPADPELKTETAVLFQLPFFYVPLILIWSYLTFRMLVKQMSFLEQLQKDVRDGYYNAHLELVPQQILSLVSNIPDDEQIHLGIMQVEGILRQVQAGALVTFLMVLEIFGSGF